MRIGRLSIVRWPDTDFGIECSDDFGITIFVGRWMILWHSRESVRRTNETAAAIDQVWGPIQETKP